MRRAREIWVGIIRQFEQSKLTQEAFADERGIPVGTLRSWIYRLRREAEESSPILPVRVIASTAPSARRPEEDGSPLIEVELGEGLLVRFPATTSPGIVAALVSELRQRC